MKRTKVVSLTRMRKNWRPFAQNSLSVAVFAALLSGCGDNEEAVIYQQVDDCVNDNPDFADQCKAAYEYALEEAARTGPKYATQNECVQEFGQNACVQAPQSSWFMPAMTGYMFARLMSNNRPYYSQPMYHSSYPGSIFYNRWVTSDGMDYGSSRYSKSKVNLDKSQMKSKPTVTKTMSRGGFGSTVSAKSSWSSKRSSSSKSWGG
jgi:uncharacterized protein YgiB involved in biofilm formation